MKMIWIICTTLICLTPVFALNQQDSLSLGNINPFSGIMRNTGNAFWNGNGILQLTALGLTPILVKSGADREVHNYFVGHQSLEPLTIPAVWGTYILPVALSTGLYTYGRIQRSQHEVSAACAVAQATVISFLYQTILKTVTGRPGPMDTAMTQEEVEKFRFGFMEGGIHYGWPSGHMMTTTSILITLQTIYPKNQMLRWGGYAYIGYVFGSVLMHEKAHMHYLSEAVAGTLMGFAIGRAVGGGFANRTGEREETSKVALIPEIGKTNGLSVQVRF